MPFIAAAPALWAAIAGLAGAGASVGEGIYSNVQNADAQNSQKQDALKAQQAQANQQSLQRQNAITASQGQAQAQTGGALSDTAFSDFAAQLAGYPGYGSSSGTPGGGVTPGTATTASAQTAPPGDAGQSPVNIQALLQQLQGGGSGGNISGGGGTGQVPNPQASMELTNPFVAA